MNQQMLFGSPVHVGTAGQVDKAAVPLYTPEGEEYEPTSGDRVSITLEAIMVPAMKHAIDPESGEVSINATWLAVPIKDSVSIDGITGVVQVRKEWDAA